MESKKSAEQVKTIEFMMKDDGTNTKAIDLKIEKSGVLIKSVNVQNGNEVPSYAIELEIDHQQILFLLLNLGQNFPFLEK